MSNVQVYIHFVFRTKSSRHSIYQSFESELYRFLWKKTEELRCIPLQVNGMPDHIHLLIKIHSQVTIASLAQHLKGASSKWIDDGNKVPAGFSWSKGYGAFSVEPRNVDMIINYIKKQKAHHNYDQTNEDLEF